eukprot:scaffold133731_cov43-Prasinocladus_malaysianus.AAC.1
MKESTSVPVVALQTLYISKTGHYHIRTAEADSGRWYVRGKGEQGASSLGCVSFNIARHSPCVLVAMSQAAERLLLSRL